MTKMIKQWRAVWITATLIALAGISSACGTEDLLGSGEGLSLKDFGTLQVVAEGSEPTKVEAPSGAVSMLVVLEGAPRTQLVQVKTITSPSGKVVFDFDNGPKTNFASTTDGLYSVLIPSSPDVSFESGEWQLTYFTDAGPFTGEVKAAIKTKSGDNSLDLNLFFAGNLGVTAATAKDDARFQAVLSDAEALFGKAGISFGEVNYEDLNASDAETYSTVSLANGEAELDALFKLSAGKSNRALNFFFVADLEGNNQGFSLLGRAGGVPGPASFHGTHRSGVVINMADFIAAASGDEAQQEKARKTTRLIMVHEAAHYLGLFHTTERNGQALGDAAIVGQDPIPDTTVCADSADADADGKLTREECSGADGGNLMFHDPPDADPTISAQQAQILKGSPLVK